MYCKDELVVANGSKWFTQEFMEGDKHEFNLYDEEGNFVRMFDSKEELDYFLRGLE